MPAARRQSDYRAQHGTQVGPDVDAIGIAPDDALQHEVRANRLHVNIMEFGMSSHLAVGYELS